MTQKLIFLLPVALAIAALIIGYFGSRGVQAASTGPRTADGQARASRLRAVVTSAEKRFADTPTEEWRPRPTNPLLPTVSFDPNVTYQDVLGFGAAPTDAACFVIDGMPADGKAKVMDELFHPTNGLNLTVCRVPMGASDYATHAYSYCDSDTPDPELTKFSLEHDKKYILPLLREAGKINPDLFLFASPWSPPGWMKPNNSMLGGNMRRRYMGPYANYFVKFLKGYDAEGVKISAVTVQNEVDTDQDGNMPACAWPQEYEIDFVRNDLGPTLEKEGLKTEIWIIDHNYNLWGRAIASLEAENALKYVKGIAWHGYVGDPGKMTVVHNAYPQIPAYWTEGGPDITDPNYTKDWVKWAKAFTGQLNNWCRSITAWNLALDEEGKPNIGPFPCGGLVTVNSKTKEVTRSGQYYAIGQFSKFVKRGAKRIDCTVDPKGASKEDVAKLDTVAFRNPDGSYVLVVTNSGPATSINIFFQGETTTFALDADSVNTLMWNGGVIRRTQNDTTFATHCFPIH